MAQEKLKLEQDVTGQGEEKGTAKKKDVARLLKVCNLLSLSMEFMNIQILWKESNKRKSEKLHLWVWTPPLELEKIKHFFLKLDYFLSTQGG